MLRFRSTPLLLLFCLSAPIVAASASGAEEVADLGSGRLVLVPVNLGVRANAEVEPGLAPVWQEMLEHFADGERPVTALERTSAGALWNEIVAELEAGGQKDVYAAYAGFAKRISEQLDYEKIVFPSLVLRKARLQGSGAYWDGVHRRVDSPLVGHEAVNRITGEDLLVYRQGLNGDIAAASLHVAVLDAGGALRFEGAGGLTVLQDVVAGEDRSDAKLDVTMREDAFSDRAELREGIVAAFRQPLPASQAH